MGRLSKKHSVWAGRSFGASTKYPRHLLDDVACAMPFVISGELAWLGLAPSSLRRIDHITYCTLLAEGFCLNKSSTAW